MPALSCITAMACLVILEFYGLEMRHCKMAVFKMPHMNCCTVEKSSEQWAPAHLLKAARSLQRSHFNYKTEKYFFKNECFL